jgi:hypothetical protein
MRDLSDHKTCASHDAKSAVAGKLIVPRHSQTTDTDGPSGSKKRYKHRSTSISGDQNFPNFKLYLSINIRRILFTYANLSSWLTSKVQRSPSTGTFCFACEDLHPPHAATYGLNRLLTLPTKPYREEKAYADHQNAGSRSPAPSASSGSSKNSTSNTASKSSSATKPAAQAPS